MTVVHAEYDPTTRGGDSADGRKVKGTIHWVSAAGSRDCEVRLYENLIDEEKGKLNEDGTLNFNPNSLEILEHAKLEKASADLQPGDHVQFIRNGYFCVDTKDTTDDHKVFNRVVGLKSSYKPAQN